MAQESGKMEPSEIAIQNGRGIKMKPGCSSVGHNPAPTTARGKRRK